MNWKEKLAPEGEWTLSDKKKRLSTFDLIKGICMLSVVGCHFDESLFRKINFTFNLPAFFLISGFFYSVNCNRLKERTIRLLKPYVFTVLLIAVVDTLKVPAGSLLLGYDIPVIQTTVTGLRQVCMVPAFDMIFFLYVCLISVQSGFCWHIFGIWCSWS